MKYPSPLIVIAMLCTASHSQAETQNFDCLTNRDNEAAVIKAAGNAIVRKGKHELLISAGGKSIHIKDKPPYDVDDAGISYSYCGRQNGYFMIFKNDQGETNFSGLLINENTGAVTPGGQTVLFSPDLRAYLATEQPDGLDGEVWKVYASDGRLSWSGFSFIPDAEEGSSYAALAHPAWTEKGVLTAEATCEGKTNGSWNVALKKINGKWDWSPKNNQSCAHVAKLVAPRR